jgi:antitoxin ParD1/3/4
MPVWRQTTMNSMTVHLTPELERLIESKLQSGRYGSASEVVRVALRLLEEHDRLQQVWTADMQGKIAEGLDQLNQGERWDGEQVFDELEAELARRTKSAPQG